MECWKAALLYFTYISYLSTSCNANSTIKFAAYIPKQVAKGKNLNLVFHLSNANSSVELNCNLTTASHGITILHKQQLISSGDTQLIKLGQIPFGNYGKFALEVKGVDELDQEVLFTNISYIQVKAERKNIIIQTDKQVYNIGQTIKFRILTMTNDMMPVDEMVKYKVENSDGDVVMIQSNHHNNMGVVSDEIEIHPTSKPGTWSITVLNENNEAEKVTKIDVMKNYEGKFKVTLTVPPFVMDGADGVTIRIQAKYPYGSFVHGAARIHVHSAVAGIPPTILSSEGFAGEQETFISMETIRELGYFYFDEKTILINAKVYEKFTGVECNESASVDLILANIKISPLSTPNVAKPGLPYVAWVKVTDYIGKEIGADLRRDASVFVEVSHRSTSSDVDVTRLHSVLGPYVPGENGEIRVKFNVPNNGEFDEDNFNGFVFSAFANISNYNRVEWGVQPIKSSSNSYIQITSQRRSLSPGMLASFAIYTTQPINSLVVTVMSGGTMLSSERLDSVQPSTLFNFNIVITKQMQPSTTIHASYIREDGELVIDSISVSVELTLEKRVQISASYHKQDPVELFLTEGEFDLEVPRVVTINITNTEPGSFVAINLLRKNRKEIAYNLDYSYKESLSSEWKNTDEILSDDINILTNAWNPQDETIVTRHIRNIEANFDPFFSNVQSSSHFFSSPDSWLWTSGFSDCSGSYQFTTKVPRAVTSWQIGAFSLSEENGFDIADPVQIDVPPKFYIHVDLPKKVIKDEIIIVQVTVFNTFHEQIEVVFELVGSDLFQFIPFNGATSNEMNGERTVTIPAHDSHSEYIPLRMTSVGDVEVEVVGFKGDYSDTLRHTVHVESKGIPRCFSRSVLFSRENRSASPDYTWLAVGPVPIRFVPGSISATLHVFGDILGATVNNLGNLGPTPTGCGEQNVMNFAPDVFITLYLQRVDRLTEKVKETAYRNILRGYQKQLNYRRSDGSFSQFGYHDREGSLWLTAFVLKCYKHASLVSEEIAEQLDEDIRGAVNYISNKMLPNGAFYDPGKISHRSLQGGTNSKSTVAAYTAIALLEAKDRNEEEMEFLRMTRAYLERHLRKVTGDVYALSIVTYALHLLRSSHSQKAFETLEELVIIEGNYRYWSNREDYHYNNLTQVYGRDVEITSYVLLTLNLRSEENSNVYDIVNWLISKQNSQGGFGNTQETILAIQALSAVTDRLNRDYEDFVVRFGQGQGNEPINEVRLNHENLVKDHHFNLQPNDGILSVEVTGLGVAVTQISVCYNVFEETDENSPFECTLDKTDSGKDQSGLQLCCRFKKKTIDQTGTFVYEIKLPSGFAIDVQENEYINFDTKMVEFKSGSANLYFDKLVHNDELCGQIEMKRYQNIAASQSSWIRVFDYYQQEREYFLTYSMRNLQMLDACSVCGSKCTGCTDAILSTWKLVYKCQKLCGDEQEIYEKECINAYTRETMDLTYCGITERPQMRKSCNHQILPVCANISTGLWNQRTTVEGEPCVPVNIPTRSQRRQRIGYSGIPATGLRSRSKQEYLSCPVFSDYLQQPTNGFSISLLIYVRQFSVNRQTYFFSYGDIERNARPIISLRRVQWSNQDARLSVSLNGKEYRVNKISTHTWLNKWVHVLVTWSDESAMVFVNGVSQGKSFLLRTNYPQAKRPPQNASFYIGQTTKRKLHKNTAFTGYVSSLLFWDSVLSHQQVTDTYAFYRLLLHRANVINGSPEISPSMLRFLAPISTDMPESCFRKALTLQRMQNYESDECYPMYETREDEILKVDPIYDQYLYSDFVYNETLDFNEMP